MPAGSTHALISAMGDHLGALAHAQDFSGAALVTRRSQPVFQAALGAADLATQAPISAETIFRIGSVTKPITAAAVFRLQDQGLLSTAHAISRYLTDLPRAWQAITIAQLLTHTSGIASYTSLAEYPAFEPLPADPRATLARVEDLPLMFQPGSGFAYSNSGYLLLGLLLEQVSGQPFETALKACVLAPLDMEDTGYLLPKPLAARLARGYEHADGSWKPARPIDISVAFAAGGLYSTVQDLARFADGLFGGRLLTPASLARMRTPAHRDGSSGWFVGEHHGHRRVWHGGAIAGYSSHLAHYPADRLTVAVLSNRESGAADTAALDLASLALGESCAPPARFVSVKVDAGTLAAYAGRYTFPEGTVAHISVDGDRLYIQPAGQERYLAHAQSRSRFFVREVNAEMDFETDQRGAVVLSLRQRGKTYVAAKDAETRR